MQSGTLVRKLEKLVKETSEHVKGCVACLAKGSHCEICITPGKTSVFAHEAWRNDKAGGFRVDPLVKPVSGDPLADGPELLFPFIDLNYTHRVSISFTFMPLSNEVFQNFVNTYIVRISKSLIFVHLEYHATVSSQFIFISLLTTFFELLIHFLLYILFLSVLQILARQIIYVNYFTQVFSGPSP